MARSYKGRFGDDIRSIMFGAGADQSANEAVVRVVEQLLVEFIRGVTRKAAARRARLRAQQDTAYVTHGVGVLSRARRRENRRLRSLAAADYESQRRDDDVDSEKDADEVPDVSGKVEADTPELPLLSEDIYEVIRSCGDRRKAARALQLLRAWGDVEQARYALPRFTPDEE